MPTSIGGYGLQHMRLRSFAAYNSSKEVSTKVIENMHDHFANPDDISPRLQHEQIVSLSQKQIYLDHSKVLNNVFLSERSNLELAIIADHANPVFKATLNILPTSYDKRLSNSAISCTIQSVLLVKPRSTCPKCSLPNCQILHQEICNNNKNKFQGKRHDRVRDAILNHFRACSDTQVEKEYKATDSNLRADGLIKGESSLNGRSSVFDVSIVSISAVKFQSILANTEIKVDESLIQFGKRLLHLIHTKVEDEKKLKYKDAFIEDFVPIVFTSFGSLSVKVAAWLHNQDLIANFSAVLAKFRLPASF